MKILFVGGGSVGHIAPSVAVLDACKQHSPAVQPLFVCSPRPDDAAFLEEKNLPFTILDAPRLSLSFPWKFLKAYTQAKAMIETFNPDVVFSKGGYISVPLCAAAKRKKIPIVAHESDAVSGHANKIVSRWATVACRGMSTNKVESGKWKVTGNPIRPEITNGSKQKGLEITGLSGTRPILLVSGGSQGAASINESVLKQLDDILLRCDVIHITGRNKSITQERTGYYAIEFAHDELADFYACADIAVSRAGASAIAEHAANGIPTILVPLREVGHDHQFINATAAVKTGGCKLVHQDQMDETLLPVIHMLVESNELRLSMKADISKLAHPDAASQIAKILVECLDSSASHQ